MPHRSRWRFLLHQAKAAAATYSTWHLELWLGALVYARTGLLRLLDTAEFVDATLARPLLVGGYTWGAVQLAVGLLWVGALFLARGRAARAAVCALALLVALLTSLSWWVYSPTLPSWHGWLYGVALPAAFCLARHVLQFYRPVVAEDARPEPPQE